MNELRIVRGTDVRLSVGETPLFGVTAFSAREKAPCHQVYEFLSAKPCETIPQGARYELELSVMALFDRQLPRERFTLCIEDGDSCYRYENCRVTEQKTEVKGNEGAVERIFIEADRMEKRRNEHE
ncbi:hypothetical protein [Ruminococcus sp.]|uniref:hypothetical protein n=1 Tax=Ruminococcus sp. TaxID=41978 RepID=UPI00388D718C